MLHVRIQTLGVIEHLFKVNTAGKIYNWKLYDVGGAVSPFFHTLTICALLTFMVAAKPSNVAFILMFDLLFKHI